MNATFETYASEFGVGYRVLVGGVAVSDQPFAPGVSGFVGMTQAQAESEAQSEVDRYLEVAVAAQAQ